MSFTLAIQAFLGGIYVLENAFPLWINTFFQLGKDRTVPNKTNMIAVDG